MGIGATPIQRLPDLLGWAIRDPERIVAVAQPYALEDGLP
jgi:hypothetical protein